MLAHIKLISHSGWWRKSLYLPLVLILTGCPAHQKIGFYNFSPEAIQLRFDNWNVNVPPNAILLSPPNENLNGELIIMNQKYVFTDNILSGFTSNELHDLLKNTNEPSVPVCIIDKDCKISLGLRIVRTNKIIRPEKQPRNYPYKLINNSSAKR